MSVSFIISRQLHLRVCVPALMALLIIPAFAQPQYTFITFGAPQAWSTDVGGINNGGDVAGVYWPSGTSVFGYVRHADRAVTTFNLPAPCPDCNARITGINDLGQMVGWMSSPSLENKVNFLRDSNGNYSILSGPPDFPSWTPYGLTNTGESIVKQDGWWYGPQEFLRTATGEFVPLPNPPGAWLTGYFALNNQGEAVGAFVDGHGYLAFLMDLSSNQFTFFNVANVVGLNDDGVAFGNMPSGDLFLRTPEGQIQAFRPDLDWSYPVGMNQAGTIVGRGGTGNADAPIFIGYPSNLVAPVISLLPGPPQQAIFSVVDSSAGLFSVEAYAMNCTVAVSLFTPGQTTPVIVTATKIDQSLNASVEIIAENTVGLVNDFDPEILTVYGNGGPKTDPLAEIPSSEHVLTVANGDPGLKKLHIDINGRQLVVPLKDNESRTINLRTWMTLESNSITFSGEGPQNAKASLVLKDAVPGASRRRRQGQ